MVFDLDWLYDIFILEAWHIFSIMLAVFFLVFICLNSRRTLLFYHYLALQLILLNWLVSKVFKTVAPTAGLKWFFIVAQYFTVAFLGSAVLMFSYLYARGRPVPFRKAVLLNILPLFFFVVIATNERHHLFYATYDFLGDTFGPLFYAYSAVTYGYITAGLGYCFSRLRREYRGAGLQSRLVMLGIIIPLFVNFLYIGRLVKMRFDITPVSYNLSLLLFAYAVYRQQFLDVIPLGISEAFHNLREGVLVADRYGAVSDKNRRMAEIPGLGGDYETLDAVNEALASATGGCARLPEAGSGPVNIVLPGEKKKHLSIALKALKRKPGGSALVFADNTVFFELIGELEESNRQLQQAKTSLEEYAMMQQRLAVLAERNRMAREVHDILGQTLVLVLNLLESGGRARLEQALAAARQGTAELRGAFGQSGGQAPPDSPAARLGQLAEAYGQTGMTVNIHGREAVNRLPADQAHTVFRICQESLTNALKHGRAGRVDIFIRLKAEHVELFIADNGTGCTGLKKGHGITGMEERVKKLGGVFSCDSEGDGFILHARWPC